MVKARLDQQRADHDLWMYRLAWLLAYLLNTQLKEDAEPITPADLLGTRDKQKELREHAERLAKAKRKRDRDAAKLKPKKKG